ncbi:Ggamma-subunit 1 [Prunus dulcis]|uniref:Ggamma-subunit 1 n=1 Tax=Prunus dulcis TaxID=3755 RepID=A0A4Y1S0J9_PRUDU|nr:Ggamma-subunit 1 [Prunus dulcis]
MAERNWKIFQETVGVDSDELWDRVKFGASLWASVSAEFKDYHYSTILRDFSAVLEELGELERTENVSTICSELLPYAEGTADPLLPVTNGPVNLLWDRWFEGPQDSQRCSCRIL